MGCSVQAEMSFLGDDLSGSFYVVSSGPEPSPATLKRENTALKSEVAAMKTRLEAMDKVIKIRKEQDLQLRDSIYMATREVNCFSVFAYYLGTEYWCRPSEHWEHPQFWAVRLLHPRLLLISVV